jgi:hypothetical protein
VYHCTPTELQSVPLDTILAHLTCLNVEAEVAELRSRKRGK